MNLSLLIVGTNDWYVWAGDWWRLSGQEFEVGLAPSIREQSRAMGGRSQIHSFVHLVFFLLRNTQMLSGKIQVALFGRKQAFDQI